MLEFTKVKPEQLAVFYLRNNRDKAKTKQDLFEKLKVMPNSSKTLYKQRREKLKQAVLLSNYDELLNCEELKL